MKTMKIRCWLWFDLMIRRNRGKGKKKSIFFNVKTLKIWSWYWLWCWSMINDHSDDDAVVWSDDKKEKVWSIELQCSTVHRPGFDKIAFWNFLSNFILPFNRQVWKCNIYFVVLLKSFIAQPLTLQCLIETISFNIVCKLIIDCVMFINLIIV